MKNLLSVVTPWLDHGAQVYNAAQRATALWIAIRLRYRCDAIPPRNDIVSKFINNKLTNLVTPALNLKNN